MTSARRGRWVPDDELNNCMGCNSEFSIFVRKHHCRKCGALLCDDCSSTRMLIPRNIILFPPENIPALSGMFSQESTANEPQRCCNTCAQQLKDEQPGLRQLVSRANKETLVDKDAYIRHLNSPYGRTMGAEIKKACYTILNCTSIDPLVNTEGISRELLWNARGIAFLTILKAGFFLSGRLGTGLVVRRLADGGWSAPCAIGISGTGWGLQIGGEVTDVMILLNTDKAVEVFSSPTQVSLGTALGMSVGPVGRAAGTDLHAGDNGVSAATFYAHSKGLFVGVSLEASMITIRESVNLAFYGENVDSRTLLSGQYPRPLAAEPLYAALVDVVNPVMHNGPKTPSQAITARPPSSIPPSAPDNMTSF